MEGLMLGRTADRINRQRQEQEAVEKAAQEERERAQAEFNSAIPLGEVQDPAIPATLLRLPKASRRKFAQATLDDAAASGYRLFVTRHPEAADYDEEKILAYLWANELDLIDLGNWEFAFERLKALGAIKAQPPKQTQERQRDPNTGQFLPFGAIAPEKRDKNKPCYEEGRGYELDIDGYPTGKLRQYDKWEIERLNAKLFRRIFPQGS
jgi:hypothetical protein